MNKDRLGFYQVGNKKFYNKPLALIEASKTNKKVHWNFNDNIFGKINWSIPVQDSLKDLYKKRALQLRESYDHISLYYTGGADSHNILLTFIEHNILIDEIVMLIPELDKKNLNDWDRSSRNIFGEIFAVAVPELQEIKNKIDKRTKIKIRDFSKAVFQILTDENWLEYTPPGTLLSPGTISRQCNLFLDNDILDLSYKGKKSCHLMGVDKPLVLYTNGEYYAYFSDASAMHCAPSELNRDHYEIFNNLCLTEFFYWTPDLPEIVIKQAQEIKKHCENDNFKKFLWGNSLNIHIGKYRSVMHPIIYSDLKTPEFQTDKPPSTIIRDMDNWFWYTANDRIKNNYNQTISYISNNIDADLYCVNKKIDNGLTAINSKFYKI